MWPLILLGLGAGYYFYKKGSTPPAVTPVLVNLPPQNTAIYTPPVSPVVQTSNGPTSVVQQSTQPSSAPAVVHAPVNILPSTFMHAAITAPLSSSAPIGPMPGVTNSHGELITWAPYNAGTITHDPSSGSWLASNQPDTISLVVTTPQGSITLPRTMIYNIDTGEIRI